MRSPPYSEPLRAGQPHRVNHLVRLTRGFMWLIALSGGFVIIEPAPYEFLIAIAMVVFLAAGLVVRPLHVPLIALLLAYNIGYLIGVVPVISLEGTAMWTAVSCFMSITTLFFALALVTDTSSRLDMLLKGYMASAIVVSLFGIVTYFHLLPGSETFIFAMRSKATFKDPNVLGAFLVLPAVLAMQRVMLGGARNVIVGGFCALVVALELLLAFSRGAWGVAAAAVLLTLLFTFLTSSSAKERLRIVVFAAAGLAVVAAVLALALTLPQVQSLFEERASLVQSYDSGRFGRFGRHILGALLALDHPFGIGPLQFSKYFPEDPHNSFLDSFMAGGWLSGAAYFGLVLLTARHRPALRVRRRAVAPCLHRSLFKLRRAHRRELHHRRAALAPLFPHHGRGMGPDRRRRRSPQGAAKHAGANAPTNCADTARGVTLRQI